MVASSVLGRRIVAYPSGYARVSFAGMPPRLANLRGPGELVPIEFEPGFVVLVAFAGA